jgi:hypothetical protein
MGMLIGIVVKVQSAVRCLRDWARERPRSGALALTGGRVADFFAGIFTTAVKIILEILILMLSQTFWFLFEVGSLLVA